MAYEYVGKDGDLSCYAEVKPYKFSKDDKGAIFARRDETSPWVKILENVESKHGKIFCDIIEECEKIRNRAISDAEKENM